MAAATASDEWFVSVVLPWEPVLTRTLRRYVADQSELVDLRQEIYLRIYEAAQASGTLPNNVIVLAQVIARNLLIDRARRSKVIAIDLASDLDFDMSIDVLTPERIVSDREDLRRFQQGLALLPERCREVVKLRRIEGLSQRECANRMGISEDTVERQVREGMRAVADFMFGGSGRLDRSRTKRQRIFGR